ncbi:MAG TPA: DNA polymerase ligase N-terminal domain-containing protein [Candidatus Nanoarchaeia archaeon]|nr:DNA polymerase ligase N-terminal domain-containing protein [Candidatus Nanoarchaeia archaeon]
MTLTQYSKKRDLKKTPEPKAKKGSIKSRIFVIHDHQASHHHWDLRLSMDGVLKSWAVPKIPPTSKGIKRLAIQVEDHPLSYAKFEGCFEFYTKIITDRGMINIGNIVNEKRKLNVLSYNQDEDKLEWKQVINWFKNGQGREWLKIRVPGQYGGKRVIITTPNHKFYTPKGIKFAGDLGTDDSLFVPGVKWSSEQLQVILGSILGDAHVELSNQTRTPQYSITHSGKQINYLRFMRDILKPDSEIRSREKTDSHRFRFSHASLIDLYPLFYKSKKKYVNEDILNLLDERGLAIWYMDDGYFSAKKFVELCTHGFTNKENELIANYLNKRWQLNAKVYYTKPKKKSTGGYFIHLSRLGSIRFLTLINNYLLPELRYKTYIEDYKNEWKFEKEKEGIIPVKILKIEKASKKDVRSLQKYDLHVKDNNNYFVGSALVSNSIPEGNYGAGTVKIWDTGTYELEKQTTKEIEVIFHGKKLNGKYVLIKTHFGSKPEKSWLFFKV